MPLRGTLLRLGTVISGDAVYNNTHPCLAECHENARAESLRALDKIEALDPTLCRATCGPQAALRIAWDSSLVKSGASFFFALNTLHCTVPMGTCWAAAIS